jgi:hypothetical protein
MASSKVFPKPKPWKTPFFIIDTLKNADGQEFEVYVKFFRSNAFEFESWLKQRNAAILAL